MVDDLPENPTKGIKKNAEPEKKLVDVIQSAMASESLNETNCENCKQKRTVERSYKLKTPLPSVFIIEVNRIAYEE